MTSSREVAEATESTHLLSIRLKRSITLVSLVRKISGWWSSTRAKKVVPDRGAPMTQNGGDISWRSACPASTRIRSR